MGLGPGNFLSNGWSLHSLCWVYHLVWTSSTVSDLICAPLFCFSVCITWDLANSTTLFLVRKERGPLQQEGGGCRPSPHWPGPTSHEGLKATLDADFAIFFLSRVCEESVVLSSAGGSHILHFMAIWKPWLISGDFLLSSSR